MPQSVAACSPQSSRSLSCTTDGPTCFAGPENTQAPNRTLFDAKARVARRLLGHLEQGREVESPERVGRGLLEADQGVLPGRYVHWQLAVQAVANVGRDQRRKGRWPDRSEIAPLESLGTFFGNASTSAPVAPASILARAKAPSYRLWFST